MEKILLTVAAGGVLLVVLYGIWGGVHLLANLRLGFRRMGCQGPRTDAYGKQVCCKTGGECEETTRQEDAAADRAESGHTGARK